MSVQIGDAEGLRAASGIDLFGLFYMQHFVPA